MDKIRVVILSTHDWANSGQRIKDALNKYTSVSARCITIKPAHSAYPYQRDVVIGSQMDKNNPNWVLARSLINNADIIHFKEDELANPIKFAEIPLPKKPIVVTHGGSTYRRKWNKIHPVESKFAKAITVTMADLLFPNTEAIFIPHLIDFTTIPPPRTYSNKKPSQLLITHAPSNREFKQTNLIEQACRELGLQLDVIQRQARNVCLERIKRGDIFYDRIQNGCGFYGNSAIEACALGLPVMTQISDEAIKLGKLEACPIVRVNPQNLKIALMALSLDNQRRIETSKKCLEWARTFHNAKIIAKRYEKIYNTIS